MECKGHWPDEKGICDFCRTKVEGWTVWGNEIDKFEPKAQDVEAFDGRLKELEHKMMTLQTLEKTVKIIVSKTENNAIIVNEKLKEFDERLKKMEQKVQYLNYLQYLNK
jgi:hypothetical protein